MVTLIGSLAAVLTTACWLPQVLKTIRKRTADVAAWTAYGVMRHDAPIYLCNSITGLLVLVVALVKVRAGRPPAGELAALAADHLDG
jgi:MtN3 and saliva related transmembrane protein